jgi:phage protein U
MPLFSWGDLRFDVEPFNVHETDHATDTDWARKEIVGAAIYREWVGENDEEITLRGRVFPYRIGGLSELEIMEACRYHGVANTLIRGDGQMLGWYVIEQLARAHRFLGAEGVGQLVNFEATFARCPVPEAAGYYTLLIRAAAIL